VRAHSGAAGELAGGVLTQAIERNMLRYNA
jgi:hypothetical protein